MGTDLPSRRLALREFLRESNEIEGIYRVTDAEVKALSDFLRADRLTLDSVNALQAVFAPGFALRASAGMDVRVGRHIAPAGGPRIGAHLADLIEHANAGEASAWQQHVAFEGLHPYLDGNGRTGRALWLHQMIRLRGERNALALPFLHRFYYQTLDAVARGPEVE